MSAADGPAGLRAALAEYVRAVHRSWHETVRAAGRDATSLPLGGAPFDVAVVAGRQLHVLATRDPLPAVALHEHPVEDALDGMAWRVRFLDATVVPELADAAQGPGPDVRTILGVDTVLYHLTVEVDGALSGHQAVHAGSGLARSHLDRGAT